MIEVENLTVERGGVEVLSGINLSVPKGNLTAIIGPNGAGKSTLLYCIAGLLRPQSGVVRVNGENIHQMAEQARALCLSLLTQSTSVVPRLTVRDLVGFGPWPHHRGRPTAKDLDIVSDALDRFGLSHLAEQEVACLSGGQKQRAYIAMTYAQSTPWMLLDEPLSALDPKFSRDIMDRLVQVVSDPETPRNVALVLHDLQTAARDATWVICMKDGRVLSHGAKDRVLSSESLSALYDTKLTLTQAEGQSVVLAG
ncbi:ATP-binding cassette domain-containing protein [Halovulum sp. GXIMD14793]